MIFVSTYSKETKESNQDKAAFATYQERVRKDVECAFGVLVQRFQFRQWYMEDLHVLVDACVIIHNMVIVERKGDLSSQPEEALGPSFALFGRQQISQEEAAADGIDLFAARVAAFEAAMESSYEHLLLKRDLVEHINKHTNRN